MVLMREMSLTMMRGVGLDGWVGVGGKWVTTVGLGLQGSLKSVPTRLERQTDRSRVGVGREHDRVEFPLSLLLLMIVTEHTLTSR